MNLHCRQATSADLPHILGLYQSALGDERILEPADASMLFAKMQQYPNYKVYVATQHGEVMGTFALLIMDNLGHLGTPSGIIEDVAVAPQHQGSGVGKQMMAFALELCKAEGCYKMVLSSNLRREAAHAFYENLGFEKHGYSFRVML